MLFLTDCRLGRQPGPNCGDPLVTTISAALVLTNTTGTTAGLVCGGGTALRTAVKSASTGIAENAGGRLWTGR
jgi:hypothetical protein